MKLVSSFVFSFAVFNALLFVTLAIPQYGPDRHNHIPSGIMPRDLSESKQAMYEELFFLEGNIDCDIDLKRCKESYTCKGDELSLENCQEEMENEILMKRETINNHQNRIGNQIILPRSLNTGHPKVTNEGISQPIFIKRMAVAPPSIFSHDKSLHQKRSTNDESVQPPTLIKRMAVGHENIVTHNGKPAFMLQNRVRRSDAEDVKMVRRMAVGNEMRTAPHDFKITMRRREYNSSPKLVKRKLVDREKSFKLNHPDSIVQKREVKNDEKQIKMVKRTAIGTEMKHVSDEHWSMPHRRENLDNPNADPVHLIKRMAMVTPLRPTHNGQPV